MRPFASQIRHPAPDVQRGARVCEPHAQEHGREPELLEAERIFPKPHPFASWLDRSRTPEAAADATTAFFLDAPAAARTAFEIAIAPDGTVESYTDEKIVLKARKGRSS